MKNYSFDKNLNKQSESVEYFATNISPAEASAIYDSILGLGMMMAVTIVGFRFLYLNSPFHLDKFKPIKPNFWQKLAQPNCQKCRFFRSNSKFQCALHSVKIDFTKAKICPDYWQSDRRRFLYR